MEQHQFYDVVFENTPYSFLPIQNSILDIEAGRNRLLRSVFPSCRSIFLVPSGFFLVSKSLFHRLLDNKFYKQAKIITQAISFDIKRLLQITFAKSVEDV